MGITTVRDVGSYGDFVVEARQAMRYGAFRGPRLLTCGRIVSATSPGGRFFDGMYREADGAADVCRAAQALGLGDRVGTIEPGKLADLLVVDGDPVEQPALLRDRDRIWLVFQLGEPVAGAALERHAIGVTAAVPSASGPG